MANIHGKNAVIYMGANGSIAQNITEMADWSIDLTGAFVDTGSLNQTWNTTVKGMIGWSGTFNGNYNPASTLLWTAHVSNVNEYFYLYPDIRAMGGYYYGLVWFQLVKAAAGSTTAKASTQCKFTGNGPLYCIGG